MLQKSMLQRSVSVLRPALVHSLLFLTIILAVFILAAPVIVSGQGLPSLPYQLYGSVRVGGVPAPDNTFVIAKVNGKEIGRTSTLNGEYGKQRLFFVSVDTFVNDSVIIESFIDNEKAGSVVFLKSEAGIGVKKVDLEILGAQPQAVQPATLPTAIATPIVTTSPATTTASAATMTSAKTTSPSTPTATTTIATATSTTTPTATTTIATATSTTTPTATTTIATATSTTTPTATTTIATATSTTTPTATTTIATATSTTTPTATTTTAATPTAATQITPSTTALTATTAVPSIKSGGTLVTASKPLSYCADSDNGKDFYVKGTTTGDYKSAGANRGFRTFNDECSLQSYVNEGYCGDDGFSYTSTFACPYGCKDGACIIGTGKETAQVSTLAITPAVSTIITPATTITTAITTATPSPTQAAPTQAVAEAKKPCSSLWKCDYWGPCTGGIQERICVDANYCTSNERKETQSCIEQQAQQVSQAGAAIKQYAAKTEEAEEVGASKIIAAPTSEAGKSQLFEMLKGKADPAKIILYAALLVIAISVVIVLASMVSKKHVKKSEPLTGQAKTLRESPASQASQSIEPKPEESGLTKESGPAEDSSLSSVSPVENYVRSEHSKGFSDDEIKESLLSAGWPEQDVDDALNKHLKLDT